MKLRSLAITLFLLPSVAVAQQRLAVVAWNMESDDSDPDVMDDRIAELDGIDLWSLSEVKSEAWTEQFELAAEDGEDANFESITGTTGASDRLAIIYDAERFELVGHFEIAEANPSGNHRAPLVAHLRIRASGDEFMLMANHLARGNAAVRLKQAEILNTWAREQTLPIICAGDLNLDWHVENGVTDHDAAFDALTRDSVWQWVKPRNMMKTQSSNRYNTVLDFILLAGPVKGWKAESEILWRDAQDQDPSRFPDDGRTTDHRPVAAMITIR